MITPTLNLERQAEALANAQKHWREFEAADKRTKPAWTIAITREAGARGTAVSQEVGKRLNWPVYDRELIERIASEMGLRADLLDSVDEKHKSFLIECVESMTARGPISELKFVRHLVEILFSLGTLGHCVIVGRGAAHVLPAESTLRIRLVGDKQERIQAIQHRLHLSAGEAAQWVATKDQERTSFVQDHFHKDPRDAANYDLVLNTSRWTIGQCADFIVQAVKELEAAR